MICKKMLLLILANLFTIFLSKTLTAPANYRATIPAGRPLYIYGLSDPFARAVAYIESRFIPDIVNPYSGARGLFQFMPVMIEEVNKIQRRKEILSLVILHSAIRLPRYTWSDAFDPVKSVEMYYIVQQWKNPEYYHDKMVKIWFGTGKQHDGKTWCNYFNELMPVYEAFKGS